MAITRAILKGERDPFVLADLCDRRVRSSREQVAKSLEGNWRPEHLLSLRVAVNLYDAYSTEILECDREMERLLKTLEKRGTPPPAEKRPSPSRNAPSFDIRVALYKMSGVDLTRINGIDVNTAVKVLSELGPDLFRFPSSKHFCSWLAWLREPGSPEERSSRPRFPEDKTGRTRHSAWRRRASAEANRGWAPTIAACVPDGQGERHRGHCPQAGPDHLCPPHQRGGIRRCRTKGV